MKWRFASTHRVSSRSSVSDCGASSDVLRITEEGKLIKHNSKNKLVLASAVAGLMSLAIPMGTAAAEEAEKVACYGINKCKGTGACGGKGHSCAGENSCKGAGFLKLDKETCLKIEGGRLTAEPEKG